MTTTQLVIGLATLLLGGGGLVAWLKAPSGIAVSNADASKTTVETVLMSLEELRTQVVDLRAEVELNRDLYRACEEHRAEDRVTMETQVRTTNALRKRIQELEDRGC